MATRLLGAGRRIAAIVAWSSLALAPRPDGRAAGLEEALRADLGGGATMDFVLIRPGTFTMGSNKPGPVVHAGPASVHLYDPWPEWCPSYQPAHKVTITKPFYLGKCEVTRAQWQAVMGKPPPPCTWAKTKEGAKDPARNPIGTFPVLGVSWIESKEFCDRLSKARQKRFRLPTEAEWEYACRAGTTTMFFWGNDPERVVDYAPLPGGFVARFGSQMPVGLKKPNPWDLYDLVGNMGQYVSALVGANGYEGYPEKDPPPGQPGRIVRGSVRCVWGIKPHGREGIPIPYAHPDIGFRVVCEYQDERGRNPGGEE